MPLQVVNPYNQEIVCTLSYDRGEGLNQKIANAQETYQQWRLVPIEKRIKEVAKGLTYFRTHAKEIAREITLQMGKPIREARREVETFFERAEYMLSISRETLTPTFLPEKTLFHRRIEHAPLGPILNIAAWNYPLLIPVNIVVPALIAGNTVLLKHSPRTPLCGQRFEEAFGNLVQNLILTNAQTSRLIADSRIQYVAFTGSVPTGRHVYKQAAERILAVGLELGGKDAAYVAEDAEIQFAVENLMDGACYNAGQSCCAVERVYVHKKHYTNFLKQAKPILKRYKLGNPMSDETTLGPLVSPSDLTKLETQVSDAVSRGARLILGGERLKGSRGNFFLPTLLSDVPNNAIIMQEESFGPVVPVKMVRDDEEALALMSDSRYGLTASIFTESNLRAERFALELPVGTVFQNRCDHLDPALPWTGVKESGIMV
ncbi:MAG: aldehyde dehydrogenase family protein [Nitrospirae bacterium]|nr:aldehyde dehydrogenase family protein [Candidatus Troglogloeales bacterium]